jgi:hypothetical protein
MLPYDGMSWELRATRGLSLDFRCLCTPARHQRLLSNEKPTKLTSKSPPPFPLSSHPRFVFSVSTLLASATQPPPASSATRLDLANDKSLPPHVSEHIEADHRSHRHPPQSPSFVFLSSIFNLSPRWTTLSKILGMIFSSFAVLHVLADSLFIVFIDTANRLRRMHDPVRYLEWQLNVNPSTLHDFQSRVQ